MKIAFASFMFLTILASCSSHHDKVMKNGDTLPALSETMKKEIVEESVVDHIASWPAESKTEATTMIRNHGVPHGVTNEMLVWNNVAPYKATMVLREPIHHKTHDDIKEYITKDQERVCDQEAMKTAEIGD